MVSLVVRMSLSPFLLVHDSLGLRHWAAQDLGESKTMHVFTKLDVVAKVGHRAAWWFCEVVCVVVVMVVVNPRTRKQTHTGARGGG